MANLVKNIFSDLRSDLRREVCSYKVRGIDSIVFLTYRCTSKCKTCNIWRRNSDERSEMDWEGWKRVFERLRDYGIKTVELFGGDALLRKDVIFKIIRFCADNKIDTYFPTNSILLDKETAEELVDAGLGTIYISLDDIGTDSDKIRGKDGSFNLVKSAIENIIRARNGYEHPKIIVCSTISNFNFKHFGNIVNFLKDYPISSIYPRCLGEFPSKSIELSDVEGVLPEPFFVSSEGKSHLLRADEVRQFREIVKRVKAAGRKENYPYVNFRNVDIVPDTAFTSGKFGIKRCQICTTLITVNPDGDVIPCLFYPGYVLGNIRKRSVGEVWGNERHRIFIRHQRKEDIRICDNCLSRTYYPNFAESLGYYIKRFYEQISNM